MICGKEACRGMRRTIKIRNLYICPYLFEPMNGYISKNLVFNRIRP